jgi:hypothetical protein
MDSPRSSFRRVCAALALIVGGTQCAADSQYPAPVFPRIDVAAQKPSVTHNRDAKADERDSGGNRGPRRRLYASAFLTVGMGLVAYWSKRKADNAYVAYLASASVPRQRRLFRRAERYDRIAGAAFLGMEAGLAVTVYLAAFSQEGKTR